MAKLTDQQKLFIVHALACFDTPQQVAEDFKERFGQEITRMHASQYDPTKESGATLGAKLRAVFEATRKAFLADISTIPVANQAYRLRAINRMAEKAMSKGNAPLAKELLEQAAKEVGGAFTNRRELTGKDGKPIKTESVGAIVSSVDPVEAARLYQEFAAGD